VVVEPDHRVDLAGQHGVLGVDTGRLVGELDVQALLGVEAELLGEHGRQVDLFVQATDHDLHGGLRATASGAGGAAAGHLVRAGAGTED